jgi:hypothetical protein
MQIRGSVAPDLCKRSVTDAARRRSDSLVLYGEANLASFEELPRRRSASNTTWRYGQDTGEYGTFSAKFRSPLDGPEACLTPLTRAPEDASPERADLCRMRHTVMPTTLNGRTVLPRNALNADFDTHNHKHPQNRSCMEALHENKQNMKGTPIDASYRLAQCRAKDKRDCCSDLVPTQG